MGNKNGTIMGRKINADESLVGLSNDNPRDDYSVYELQLDNGSYFEYTAIVILENMEEQVDDVGSKYSII